MPEPISNDERTAASLQAGLHDLAEAVRQADHLSPETQRTLSELVDELGGSVRPETLSPAETAHLTENLAHLTQALQQREDRSVLSAARDRIEKAAVLAEVKAPVATGILRRLLDVLADLGI